VLGKLSLRNFSLLLNLQAGETFFCSFLLPPWQEIPSRFDSLTATTPILDCATTISKTSPFSLQAAATTEAEEEEEEEEEEVVP